MQKTNEKVVFLRRIKTHGIKGFNKPVEFSFVPTKSTQHLDNVEFFGLKRNKYNYGALKTNFIIGQNGAGKSTAISSIHSLFVFMKYPSNWIYAANENKYFFNATNKMDNEIIWDTDFSFKYGNNVYFMNYKAELVNSSLKSESLTFKKANMNGVESEISNIFNYSLANRELQVGISNSVKDYFMLAGTNGFMKFKSDLRLMNQIKSDFPEDYNAISFFIVSGISSCLSSDENSMRHMRIAPLEKMANDTHRRQYMLLYKLFDKRIESVNSLNDQLMIKYNFGNNVTRELTLEEFIYVTSGGGIRLSELVWSIMEIIYRKSGFLLIDEIEKSLHSSLAEFVSAFIIDHVKGQTFISTHDLNLVSEETLEIRSDQINVIIANENGHTVVNGSEIAGDHKKQFRREYIKREFLSSPDGDIRSEIFDEFKDFEN